ncbi:unnamed protein product [Angiostrongylus costaricensis]|uniref:CBS domain-containing protein n=1 Tax=Angiostrongylus costaricensis TaxID=334426 RepID=A0A0R3PUW7_ANGCS|nr:unnamed protein product [Angiostrongylus costaricensis]
MYTRLGVVEYPEIDTHRTTRLFTTDFNNTFILFLQLICFSGSLTKSSLLEAVRMLATYRVHRLPVIDPISLDPVGVLTPKRILRFLWHHGQDIFQPSHCIKTPKQLNIGTWKGIHVVYPHTPLIDCLDILLNMGVSSVPVVEHLTLRVIDAYCRCDAMNIAMQNEDFKLKINVKQALEFKTFATDRACAVIVSEAESFYKVICKLVETNVHRAFIINCSSVIRGIVSISDVMKAVVLEPGSHLNSYCISHRRFAEFLFETPTMETQAEEVDNEDTKTSCTSRSSSRTLS